MLDKKMEFILFHMCESWSVDERHGMVWLAQLGSSRLLFKHS